MTLAAGLAARVAGAQLGASVADSSMSTVMDNVAGKGRNLGTNVWLLLLGASVIVFAANTGYATWKAARLGGASTVGIRPAGELAEARQPGP